MPYHYLIVDVFTSQAFGGNQLAVFPDASGLRTAQMQAVARELNFAETTFVFPATGHDAVAKVRILTPGREVDFAGEIAPHGNLYARMFAPALGIAEDPASGSACAALAGVLAMRHGESDGTFAWHVDQGVALGRPSAIEIAATKHFGALHSVAVSGYSVIVADGQMHVPND